MADEYLFISDCHLDPSKPEINENLIEFLRERASAARYLYILGDLFEVWLGDDDPAPEHRELIEILFVLSKTTRLYFLAGNRDFLVGAVLAQRAGFEIITEPVFLSLSDQKVVLLHGDTLCTDDHDYQAFRTKVRNPQWQAEFLRKPLVERQNIAVQLRADSSAATAQKEVEIMDVNHESVQSCFNEHQADIMIHGHTHRPGIHHYGSERIRYVLGDWNPDPSFLSWSSSKGFQLLDLRIA